MDSMGELVINNCAPYNLKLPVYLTMENKTLCINLHGASQMKVLVAVKRVIDCNVKVRLKADGSDVDLANVKMPMNPFDEIAVEEAIRLRQAGRA